MGVCVLGWVEGKMGVCVLGWVEGEGGVCVYWDGWKGRWGVCVLGWMEGEDGGCVKGEAYDKEVREDQRMGVAPVFCALQQAHLQFAILHSQL